MSPAAFENSRGLDFAVLRDRLRYPGISTSSKEIETLAESIARRHAVHRFKERVPVPWVVFIGGTGTGKSTLFNALCRRDISKTGVERPQTEGPILYLHSDIPLKKHFPFGEALIEGPEGDPSHTMQTAGSAGSYTVIRHDRSDAAHLVLADAPDVDSVDRRHREIVEDLFLMADYVVFTASQEKYADEVPTALLRRTIEEGLPYSFILNKASDSIRTDDVIGFFASQGIILNEAHTAIIPYIQGGVLKAPWNSDPLKNAGESLLRCINAEKDDALIREGRERFLKVLYDEIDRLLELLSNESEAAASWRIRLDTLFQEKGREMLATMADRCKKGNLLAIRQEVRKIFSRYDILAGPRRYVSGLVSLPLRLVGLRDRPHKEVRKKELIDAGRRIDFSPVLFGIDDINRTVMETFSPSETGAPLHGVMRNPGVVMSPGEITERLEALQGELATWLEETFRDLMKGIPKHKELGIYSTSILWGVAVISFEIVLGGGFGLFEAVIDSFIAPFITKGSSELFAYNELRQIARDLDNRYREGLLAILDEQKFRYHECLASVTTTEDTFTLLRRLGREGETMQ